MSAPKIDARALAVLAHLDVLGGPYAAEGPRAFHKLPGALDFYSTAGPLARLVEAGLVDLDGGPPKRWRINEAGRARLAGSEGK